MSKSSPQTTTQVSEPPKYIAPYLNQAAQAASQQYGAGGVPVIPFSGQTQQALNLAEQRALAGSPVSRAANDYAQQTLSGGFMGSNPYLDQTFNRAAMATQNQLASQFARSGRGQDASQFLRSEQLNNLATQIYGGDYEAERARMQQLVPLSGGLASQDYMDINQLANVGAQYEGLSREQAAQPGVALDQYLARLQGFPGGVVTQSTPTQRNPLAGALGGSQVGSMFGPWGMLGGAILGGVYG